MHKAKDGYKISVKGYQDEPPLEVVTYAQKLFEDLGATVTRVLRHGSFKVQGISPQHVFSQHARIFHFHSVPYTLLVKPFDTTYHGYDGTWTGSSHNTTQSWQAGVGNTKQYVKTQLCTYFARGYCMKGKLCT